MTDDKFRNIILNPFRIIGHIILFVPCFLFWCLIIPFLILFGIYFVLKDKIKLNYRNIFYPFTGLYYGIFKQTNEDFFVMFNWDF